MGTKSFDLPVKQLLTTVPLMIQQTLMWHRAQDHTTLPTKWAKTNGRQLFAWFSYITNYK